MFLVMRGTTCEVVKPNGQRVKMKTRKDLLFGPHEFELMGYHFLFRRGGYTLMVMGNVVRNVWVTCPGCGKEF